MKHMFNQTAIEDKFRIFCADFTLEVRDAGRRCFYKGLDDKTLTVVLSLGSFGASDLLHAQRVAQRHGLEISYWATSADPNGFDVDVYLALMKEWKTK